MLLVLLVYATAIPLVKLLGSRAFVDMHHVMPGKGLA